MLKGGVLLVPEPLVDEVGLLKAFLVYSPDCLPFGILPLEQEHQTRRNSRSTWIELMDTHITRQEGLSPAAEMDSLKAELPVWQERNTTVCSVVSFPIEGGHSMQSTDPFMVRQSPRLHGHPTCQVFLFK